MGRGSHGNVLTAFEIKELEVSDSQEFMRLQDMFADEHKGFTRNVYAHLTLRDWQLNLLCPAHILDMERGRESHVKSLAKKDEACYQNLFILKAVTRENGSPPCMVGFIMFQVHVEVKQLYVRREARNYGCGKHLFDSMVAMIPEDG